LGAEVTNGCCTFSGTSIPEHSIIDQIYGESGPPKRGNPAHPEQGGSQVVHMIDGAFDTSTGVSMVFMSQELMADVATPPLTHQKKCAKNALVVGTLHGTPHCKLWWDRRFLIRNACIHTKYVKETLHIPHRTSSYFRIRAYVQDVMQAISGRGHVK